MPKETSKRVLFVILLFCGAAAISIIVGWFLGRSNAAGMLSIVMGLAGICASFYSWKAKGENIEKIRQRKGLTDDMLLRLLDHKEKHTISTSAIYGNDTTDDDAGLVG